MNDYYQSYSTDQEGSGDGSGLARFVAQTFKIRRILVLLVATAAIIFVRHEIKKPAQFFDDSVSKPTAFLVKADSESPIAPEMQILSNPDQARGAASRKLSSSFEAASLIQDLLSRDQGRALTEAQAYRFRSMLLDLAQLGPRAIPDIRQFLWSGVDDSFDMEEGMPFEYSSMRIALIDTLRQIGGFEAEQVLLEQLSADLSVAELAAFADALEWLQPGLYTETIVRVAGEYLAVLSFPYTSGVRTESGPLFQVFQNYGNGDTASILYQVPYWLQDYAKVALANLPDEQGIAGLAQQARRDLRGSQHSRSLHLLAQAAVVKPQAEEALLALAHSGQIPDTFWPTIGVILMGDQQLQIENPSLNPERIGSVRGNIPYAIHTTVDRQVQIVYSVNYSAVMSSEEVAARLGLISTLMNVTNNPVAISALEDARATLESYY
jgi:hypothetical protein